MSTEPYRNSNMDQRPSNTSLFITALIEFIVAAFTGGIIVMFLAVISRGLPLDILSWSFIAGGAVVALLIYQMRHFRYAKKQKTAYISAGGDPTGINLFMFGAMGGKIRQDGIWEWTSRHDNW